jgi:hypothetical protein
MKASHPSAQNRSHAVMSQRFEGKESLDDFPTPPWATRALMEQILSPLLSGKKSSCLEPACGRGFMSEALKEYFYEVDSKDIFEYGYGEVDDFLSSTSKKKYDWVITNPPFKNAEEFILKGLSIANKGVAVLVRTVFLESVGRYERLFSKTPPSIVAQFVERVPMVQGRVDKQASTATGYAWIIWTKDFKGKPLMRWIAPCRKLLEKETDYIEPSKRFGNVIKLKSTNKKSAKLVKNTKTKSVKQQRDLFD